MPGSGQTLRERKPVIHNDYASLPTKKGASPWPRSPSGISAFLSSMRTRSLPSSVSGTRRAITMTRILLSLTLLCLECLDPYTARGADEGNASGRARRSLRILAETVTCAIIIHGGNWVVQTRRQASAGIPRKNSWP